MQLQTLRGKYAPAADMRLQLALHHWSLSNMMAQAEAGMLNFAGAVILIHMPCAVWPTVS